MVFVAVARCLAVFASGACVIAGLLLILREPAAEESDWILNALGWVALGVGFALGPALWILAGLWEDVLDRREALAAERLRRTETPSAWREDPGGPAAV